VDTNNNGKFLETIVLPKDIKSIKAKIMPKLEIENYMDIIAQFVIGGYKDINLDEIQQEK
jgi:hypothetical protein